MRHHYHDSDDLKLLKDMKELAPTEFGGFIELDKVVGREEGRVPKLKSLCGPAPVGPRRARGTRPG